MSIMITVSTILAFYVSFTSCSPLPMISTPENPPCFMNDTGNALVKETLELSLEKISTRINVLKHRVEFHIQIMNERYCVDVSDEELATASFMGNVITNADYNNDNQFNIYNDSNTFLGVIGIFYEMLNKLAGYFQQLRHTAKEEPSLKRLIDTQDDIYDVMCSIKIAMISNGEAPKATVPSESLSDLFIQYRQGIISTCIQQTSEYVTMVDTLRVANHLGSVINE